MSFCIPHDIYFGTSVTWKFIDCSFFCFDIYFDIYCDIYYEIFFTFTSTFTVICTMKFFFLSFDIYCWIPFVVYDFRVVVSLSQLQHGEGDWIILQRDRIILQSVLQLCALCDRTTTSPATLFDADLVTDGVCVPSHGYYHIIFCAITTILASPVVVYTVCSTGGERESTAVPHVVTRE